MRILLTGVTGLLGRAMARQLVAAGHAVSGIADPSAREPASRRRLCLRRRSATRFCSGWPMPPMWCSTLPRSSRDVPDSAGIDGLVRVAHASARGGARLIFVSAAAGPPTLYEQAETLVASGWAPSLVVRIAPPVGRQLDWMICRTVASLLHSKTFGRAVAGAAFRRPASLPGARRRDQPHRGGRPGQPGRHRRRPPHAACCDPPASARGRARVHRLGPADARPRRRGATGGVAIRIRLAYKRCHRRYRARAGRPQARRHGHGDVPGHLPLPVEVAPPIRTVGRRPRCSRPRRTSRRASSTTGSTRAFRCSVRRHWPRRCRVR